MPRSARGGSSFSRSVRFARRKCRMMLAACPRERSARLALVSCHKAQPWHIGVGRGSVAERGQRSRGLHCRRNSGRQCYEASCSGGRVSDNALGHIGNPRGWLARAVPRRLVCEVRPDGAPGGSA
eukprot:4717056-Pyramimonas_sp.AAC.1